MAAIYFPCPKCGTKYCLDESKRGKHIHCRRPDCAHIFRLLDDDSALPELAYARAPALRKDSAAAPVLSVETPRRGRPPTLGMSAPASP